MFPEVKHAHKHKNKNTRGTARNTAVSTHLPCQRFLCVLGDGVPHFVCFGGDGVHLLPPPCHFFFRVGPLALARAQVRAHRLQRPLQVELAFDGVLQPGLSGRQILPQPRQSGLGVGLLRRPRVGRLLRRGPCRVRICKRLCELGPGLVFRFYRSPCGVLCMCRPVVQRLELCVCAVSGSANAFQQSRGVSGLLLGGVPFASGAFRFQSCRLQSRRQVFSFAFRCTELGREVVVRGFQPLQPGLRFNESPGHAFAVGLHPRELRVQLAACGLLPVQVTFQFGHQRRG